jgi:hypothetical protein
MIKQAKDRRPPEYFGANPLELAANQASVDREAARAS